MEPITRQEHASRDADAGLIRRILNGDDTALGALYDRYGRLVYSVSLRILRDTGAAEEVLQDIFYQLWRVAGSFDFARGSLSSWLMVMARNRSIDRLRRRGLTVAENPVGALPPARFDLESDLARKEMVGRVRGALDALPEPQRKAMELAYFEGLTQSEIAEQTGDPLGTVKTRLRAALTSLRKVFGT
ncbi:MAG TPA: sigma-70 family RNA polymerase sigma factor [Terriglobia bacterium]|nr:sigma-70 family RNA polymerase sigma factor [Terriglobia bacterium]